MDTVKKILWGIILIIAGILLGAKALGIISFDIFFDGWWTLFIIIPSLISLFTDENKTCGAICLTIGILLLLGCQDVINLDIVWQLIFPIIIIIIGISLLFSRGTKANVVDSKVQEEYTAIFSGQEIKLDKKKFKGTSINTIFGGIELDLRDAIIDKDIVIKGKVIFGGIDIYLPNNVKVQIKSNSIFGGIDNKHKTDKQDITVYIEGTCVFGGIDIK